MSNIYKIGTFNVRGLRDQTKRSKVFNYVRSKSFDIIALQETHSTIGDKQLWTSQWGGKIYYSHEL